MTLPCASSDNVTDDRDNKVQVVLDDKDRDILLEHHTQHVSERVP